jgi:ankyrin repeat protein
LTENKNSVFDQIEGGRIPSGHLRDIEDYAGNSVFHYAINFGCDDLVNRYTQDHNRHPVRPNYKGQTVEDVARLSGDASIMSGIKNYSKRTAQIKIGLTPSESEYSSGSLGPSFNWG